MLDDFARARSTAVLVAPSAFEAPWGVEEAAMIGLGLPPTPFTGPYAAVAAPASPPSMTTFPSWIDGINAYGRFEEEAEGDSSEVNAVLDAFLRADATWPADSTILFSSTNHGTAYAAATLPVPAAPAATAAPAAPAMDVPPAATATRSSARVYQRAASSEVQPQRDSAATAPSAGRQRQRRRASATSAAAASRQRRTTQTASPRGQRPSADARLLRSGHKGRPRAAQGMRWQDPVVQERLRELKHLWRQGVYTQPEVAAILRSEFNVARIGHSTVCRQFKRLP
ncbi:hypothetical protein C2E21_6564 [Chlorella sorokiniana]|uniref:Uncharacterized protein n=1 Tax=Chlorella sorokiniana TaxID=3076 RepID=A0A2P6TK01_CHLSO|nr:hypothetical protein C2E21_6564 [Chlorella sorokiniana]|eukprot:PRW44414.1 hypothetical protein C2E21_6564 [Chlorella sorokiniana]